MHILILGNGFDLAHGLKTKYSDFLNYCAKKMEASYTYDISDPYKTNLWIRHFLIVQHKMNENWINLEVEIYNVLKFFHEHPSIPKTKIQKTFVLFFDDTIFNFYDFHKYFYDSSVPVPSGVNGYVRFEEYNLMQYKIYFSEFEGLINFLYDQLREFTKLFEDYLLNEVLKQLPEKSKYQLSLTSIWVGRQDKDVRVLSFNYTDICEKLYNASCEWKIKPVYVHGKVQYGGDCNLVLGTKTFETPKNKFPFPAYFNIFQKHYQRHKYQTIEPYQDLIREIKKSTTMPIFHIIGHSLDDTDKKILKHVLQANDDCIINIYFHEPEVQKILMDNINLIITEEEVMSKVRFIHLHNDERSILKPKVESVVTK